MKKKVTKATAKKVVKKTKKATAIAKVKVMKHKKVVLEPIGTESLPDMVMIASAPVWANSIVGKRYVTESFAISAIEALDSEKVIARGAKSILKEMDAAGIVPMNVENI
jgi:hypothetical protein